MKNMSNAFRYAAVRWVGAKFPFNTQLLEEFKYTCTVRAWDSASKTWFFPEPYVPLVEAMLRKYLPEFKGARLAVIPGGASVEKVAPWRSNDNYTVLGLRDNAPDGLVEVAYRFWRREFDLERSGTGTAEPLMQVERAYTELTGRAP